MCSVSNTELLLAGTAFKMYQNLNPIPGYSAFTATCSVPHHFSVQGEDWGKANSDRGTTPSLQGHGSPPWQVTLLSPRELLPQMCQQSCLWDHTCGLPGKWANMKMPTNNSLNYLRPIWVNVEQGTWPWIFPPAELRGWKAVKDIFLAVTSFSHTDA